ncbi:MAG: hypothetical protein ACLQDY_15295 [Streptosporangiaceae bacterium]
MSGDAALADRMAGLEAKIRALFVVMEMIAREAGYRDAGVAAFAGYRGEPPRRHLSVVSSGVRTP